MNDTSQPRKMRPGLIASIKNGQAVPVLSDEAIFDLVLPGHLSLAQEYARCFGYLRNDQDNLPRMTKFYKLSRQRMALLDGDDYTYDDLRADFCNFVKDFICTYAEKQGGTPKQQQEEAQAQRDGKTVTEFAKLLGYPRFDRGPDDPLQKLANLPFRALITTSPYTFLEAALSKAGKTPRTVMIPWRQKLRDLDDQYIPEIPAGIKPDRYPLVCHLFGLDSNSSSLVLTEDDYLEFLVDVNRARGDDKRDSVPAQVRKALSSDLLVLGFSLNSWAFRTFYAGLIKSEDTRAEKRGICVQLPPNEAERDYLRDYLQREARFEVIWSDLNQYTYELPSLYEDAS